MAVKGAPIEPGLSRATRAHMSLRPTPSVLALKHEDVRPPFSGVTLRSDRERNTRTPRRYSPARPRRSPRCIYRRWSAPYPPPAVTWPRTTHPSLLGPTQQPQALDARAPRHCTSRPTRHHRHGTLFITQVVTLKFAHRREISRYPARRRQRMLSCRACPDEETPCPIDLWFTVRSPSS